MKEPPSGTITLLFSDIEGSTKLLQRAGDSYADLLADHRRLLRAAFDAQGAYEVDTEGDAFFVVFSAANDAAAAASEAQRALARHDWPEGIEVRVRIGLHTGEPRVIDSAYVGLDVHRAARVMAAGHGGQVLISQPTRDLLDETFRLRDLGEHRLKDLSQPQRLYQLQIEGLPSEFPPLKTLEDRPTNLPVQATTLVGREHELDQIEDILRRSAVRLVTLTGPGGIGKTRLALQAAANSIDDFTNGVFFVSLAPIREADLVIPTIARTLGLREQSGESIGETLDDYLHEKEMLLVLDNFEQVVDAAPAIASLLVVAANVKVLSTSRARLDLSGEHIYDVPPLRLPDPAKWPEKTALAQFESVALFVDRARSARSDFVFTDENAPAIAEICTELDGLPLALELAAARISSLSPQALLGRLDRRLQLLTGGKRDVDARQRTLRATIEWSYELLSENEKKLFERLGVFVDGCRPEAAEEVCDLDDLQRSVLDLLTSLTEKSLVRHKDDPDGEPRFWMLETIRELALDRLDAHGEVPTFRDRHLQYYAKLAERAEPHLKSTAQREWLERLDAEHANLREAFEYGIGEGDDIAASGRLATRLFEFLDIHGHLDEGRHWFTALLRHNGSLLGSIGAEATRAAGLLALREGEATTAVPLLERAVELFDAMGDQRGLAISLSNLAFGYYHLDDIGAAERAAKRGDAAAQIVGDPWVLADVTGALAAVAFEKGETERAEELGKRTLSWFTEAGDDRNRAIWLFNLGVQAGRAGTVDVADQLLEEAAASGKVIGDDSIIANALWARAELSLARGDVWEALPTLREALVLQKNANMKHLVGACLEAASFAMAKMGDAPTAARLLGAADGVFARLGMDPKLVDLAGLRTQATEMLEARLEKAQLDEALEQGSGLTLEAAVEAALEALADPR